MVKLCVLRTEMVEVSSECNSGALVRYDSVINYIYMRPWSVAPPGCCNRGEVRYGSIGGLEYEVPQSRLYCLCINVALCSTALQCICSVIRRSSMTMKAHTYYIIFGRPPIGGSFPPSPLAAPLTETCFIAASSSPGTRYRKYLTIISR